MKQKFFLVLVFLFIFLLSAPFVIVKSERKSSYVKIQNGILSVVDRPMLAFDFEENNRKIYSRNLFIGLFVFLKNGMGTGKYGVLFMRLHSFYRLLYIPLFIVTVIRCIMCYIHHQDGNKRYRGYATHALINRNGVSYAVV